MIEIFISGGKVQGTGMIPGQEIIVHVEEKTYHLTRFGTTCIGGCEEEKEKKETT